MSAFKEFVQGVRNNDTGGTPINPPLTQTASSHSIVIKTNRGIKVGRIQSWSPNMAMTVDSEFEVQRLGRGEPIDRINQIQNANSISVERFELYNSFIGQAFGAAISNTGGNNGIEMVSLSSQKKPFIIREIMRSPFGEVKAYVYVNCFFSNWGITIAATDDRIIRARATIEFGRRIKLN